MTAVLLLATVTRPAPAAVGSPPGAAGDRVPIRTTRLVLRSAGAASAGARLRFASRSHTADGAGRILPPARGSARDPTRYGAVLRVYGAGSSTDLAVHALPADGWRAVGGERRAKGFRFRGRGAVRSVVLAPDAISIRGRIAYTLDEPHQGAVAVDLVLGASDGAGWCAMTAARAQGTPPSTARDDRPRRFVGATTVAPPVSCPSLPSSVTTTIVTTSTTSSTIPALWSALHAAVIAPRCASCHGQDGEAGLSGLEACTSGYASLVNVPSTELPGRDRVEPGAPALSWLVQKVEGTQDASEGQCTGGSCGDAMSLEPPPLDPAARDAIIAWIAGGAANDCP